MDSIHGGQVINNPATVKQRPRTILVEILSMRRSFGLTAIALLIILNGSVRAQAPADLPKAETILDQYIEATGGKAAYEKIKNRTASGAIELAAAKVNGSVRMTAAEPNRMIAVTEFGPLGKTVQGTDGKSAWILSPVLGDRLLDGAEKDNFLFSALFHKDFHWKDVYQKVECTGVEDVDGKPAYKVVLTPKTARPLTQFFDKASHLQVKETMTQSSPMGDITVDLYPSDYKKVDGILVPFKVTQKLLGQSIEMKMNEIKFNVDLPADTFKRPASLEETEKKKAN
jgi:zinc protease